MSRSWIVSPCLAALLLAASRVAAQQPPAADKQRVEGVDQSFGYARAVRVGNTVYLSGIASPGATMEAQLTNVYAGIARALQPFGATLADVVKETVYATDIEALKAANPARRRAYGAHTPAATWVQISRLFSERAMVEVDVIVVPGSGQR